MKLIDIAAAKSVHSSCVGTAKPWREDWILALADHERDFRGRVTGQKQWHKRDSAHQILGRSNVETGCLCSLMMMMSLDHSSVLNRFLDRQLKYITVYTVNYQYIQVCTRSYLFIPRYTVCACMCMFVLVHEGIYAMYYDFVFFEQPGRLSGTRYLQSTWNRVFEPHNRQGRFAVIQMPLREFVSQHRDPRTECRAGSINQIQAHTCTYKHKHIHAHIFFIYHDAHTYKYVQILTTQTHMCLYVYVSSYVCLYHMYVHLCHYVHVYACMCMYFGMCIYA